MNLLKRIWHYFFGKEYYYVVTLEADDGTKIKIPGVLTSNTAIGYNSLDAFSEIMTRTSNGPQTEDLFSNALLKRDSDGKVS